MVIKGTDGYLTFDGTTLMISRKGIASFLAHGLKGDKTIPLASITAVQFKKAGFFNNGYIQFSLLGGVESGGGLGAATHDENTVSFTKLQMAEFQELRESIQRAIAARASGASAVPAASSVSPMSVADELAKLAALKDNGVLTETEFQEQKKKALSR